MDNRNMPDKDTTKNLIDDIIDDQADDDTSDEAIAEELDPDIAMALNPTKSREKPTETTIDYIPETDLAGVEETHDIYEEAIETIY